MLIVVHYCYRFLCTVVTDSCALLLPFFVHSLYHFLCTRGFCLQQEIADKYHLSNRQVLFNWMDRYVNEREIVSLPESEEDMSRKPAEERVKELETEVKRLSKALELERLRSEAYSTMIDLAEKTFNIPVRKKSGTKQ